MISRPWTDFCVQYCCSQIDQIEYQGQIRNTRILESKPLIDTYYCIRHRLELEIFSLCTISAQSSSSSSWTGRRFRSGLCTGFDSEHAAMSYFIPREQWTIERLSEVMGAALVGYLSPIEPNSIENFISHEKKKKLLVAARNLQTIKIFLTLELSQFVLAVRPPQAVQEQGPKSSAIYFAVKTFDCLLVWTSGVITRWLAGARTGIRTWTLPPDQRVEKVLSAPKSLNKLRGVWILFRSVENVEIKDSCESISTLINQTDQVPRFNSGTGGVNSLNRWIEKKFKNSKIQKYKCLQWQKKSIYDKIEIKFCYGLLGQSAVHIGGSLN